MTAAPFSGQTIGLAHHATRAVIERELDRHGLGFPQWIAINLVGTAGRLERDDLLHRLDQGLKLGESATASMLADLVTPDGLLELGPTGVALTPRGQELYRQVHQATDDTVASLYAGLPAEDLAITARTLATITARANAATA